MALAATAKYEQFVLEVEFQTGTWSRICGVTDVTINRQSQIDTTEVPDCDDESLPLAIERAVRAQEVTVSGTGVWALSSHERMMDWWYGGNTFPTRIRNLKAVADGVVGDTITETGPAILVTLSNARTKGQKVTAEIEIQFDGVPTRAAKTV
jgi:hypothetical protein